MHDGNNANSWKCACLCVFVGTESMLNLSGRALNSVCFPIKIRKMSPRKNPNAKKVKLTRETIQLCNFSMDFNVMADIRKFVN